MNKLVIACMMCLACVSVTSAGCTDPLWNESEDRVYYDCGDWSGVENPKNVDIGSHYYGFRKSCSRNGWYLSTLTNWGYPSDARSCGGVSDDIAWCCMYINGFDKTLHIDGVIYTDDKFKINYKTSYMRYEGFTTQYYRVYKTEYEIIMESINNTVYVKNDIMFYSKYTDDDGDDHYKTSNRVPTDSIHYKLWTIPNSTVSAELINHSNYMILNVKTPEDITGIKIVATSENITAIYEKHTHCLKLNTSKSFMTCDLVDWKYNDFSEMIPFGHDSYLLQYEPDYNINVTLYTPFEIIDAVVIINETDAEPINTDLNYDSIWDLLYIAIPISLIIWLVGLI